MLFNKILLLIKKKKDNADRCKVLGPKKGLAWVGLLRLLTGCLYNGIRIMDQVK
jgi:hypothetical protein